MRNYILFFLLAGHFSGTAQLKGAVQQQNQPPKGNEKREVVTSTPKDVARSNAEKLRTSLKLTQAQYEGLLKVFTDYEVGVDKVQKSNQSRQEKFDKTNALSITRRKKMKQILTPDQYNAYIMSFP